MGPDLTCFGGPWLVKVTVCERRRIVVMLGDSVACEALVHILRKRFPRRRIEGFDDSEATQRRLLDEHIDLVILADDRLRFGSQLRNRSPQTEFVVLMAWIDPTVIATASALGAYAIVLLPYVSVFDVVSEWLQDRRNY